MASATAVLAFSSPSFPKPFFPLTVRPRVSISSRTLTLTLLLNYHSLSPLPLSHLSGRSLRFFQLRSGVQEITVEREEGTYQGAEEESEEKQKIYVANLPWNFSATDIDNLFGQCGTVKDVEIIKQKNGKSRGFAFVTMGSVEEARAAVVKFDSHELLGRIIRVEYAKSLNKPSPPPENAPVGETRHTIYVSNLAWKVRSTNLRELFSASFKPVSAKVVFDSPSGKSAGYGFVSFATKEDAESAISELDGKELMGRPIRLQISQKKDDESGSIAEVADDTEGKVEGS